MNKKKKPTLPSFRFEDPDNQQIIQSLSAIVFPTREAATQCAIDYVRHYFISGVVYRRNFKDKSKKKPITSALQTQLTEYVRDHGVRSAIGFFAFPSRKETVNRLNPLFYALNPQLNGRPYYIDAEGNPVKCSKHFLPRLKRMWNEIWDREIARYFTAEVICDYISENPRYPFVYSGKRAQAEILNEIPEEMPMLFPEARRVQRHFILHIGPTNSGKTYEALQACKKADRGIYLAPLRLLAMEVSDRLNSEGIPCSMRTGEEEYIIPGAQHVAATMEMMDYAWYDVAVLDECQMIADPERGWAWTQAVLGVQSSVIHACMADEARNLMTRLIESCGDTWEIRRHEREIPLIPESKAFSFPEDVREGDALVVFSRRSVLQAASLLEDNGLSVSVIYGALPYHARRAETEKFASGETKIVVCTDAIGMGMNLPVKRIVFLESKKFDGHIKRELSPAEIKQIAGRAGRRGFTEEGRVNALYDKEQLIDGLYTENTPLAFARINLPERVITIDRPLSALMTEWEKIEDKPPYQKTAMKRNIQLCEWLEKHCADMEKEEQYRGITIPFDEGEPELLEIWKKVMHNRSLRIPVLEGIGTPTAMPGNSLETLERKYKKLDLLYAVLRTFPLESEAALQKQYIMECKVEVTEAIIQKLKENKQEYKTCRRCGYRLPWNYPYRICDHCRHAIRMQKRKVQQHKKISEE